jgi:hypothetical protein
MKSFIHTNWERKSEFSYSMKILKNENDEVVSVEFPASKRYYLDYRTNYSTRGELNLGISKLNLILSRFKTINEAVNEFLMDTANEPIFKALFEHEEKNVVNIVLVEEIGIELYRDSPIVVMQSSETDYTDKLLTDPRTIEAYQELQRAIEAERARQKEIDDTKLKDKMEVFYKQWEWLEKKRLNGEFDMFLEDAKA